MAQLLKPAEADCPVTSWYGDTSVDIRTSAHRGIDYGWLSSDPNRTQRIYAAFSGRVVSVYSSNGWNSGWGNRIVIDHGHGVQTAYAHIRPGGVLVKVGDYVTGGQHIAMMGTTGNSEGVHLHFELYIGGERVDPRPYREGKALPIPDEKLDAYQRRVGAEPANRRSGPGTSYALKEPRLEPGEIGNFIGVTRGETVEGIDLWYQGTSGDWFWAGCFVEKPSATGLAWVAPPLTANQRLVRVDSLNGRSGPGTAYPLEGEPLTAGEIGNFIGWARGELVTIEGIPSNIWLKGISGRWFAAAGLTSQETKGLTETAAPTVPPSLEAWPKVYPGTASVHPSPNCEPRRAGSVLKYLFLHGTANLTDHTQYFMRKNERNVAPNFYLRPSGEWKEFVRVAQRAFTTAVPADHEAITIEIECNVTKDANGVETWHYTDAQYEALGVFAAWLVKQEKVDGVKNEITLALTSLIGHKNAPGVKAGATTCPGGLDIARIIRRAQEIVNPPAPTPGDTVVVSRESIEGLITALQQMLGGVTA